MQGCRGSVLSTAEVANEVPLARRSVFNRLVSLREEGQVRSKDVGPRNIVWWLSEEAAEQG